MHAVSFLLAAASHTPATHTKPSDEDLDVVAGVPMRTSAVDGRHASG